METTTSEVLNRAADLIEGRGWAGRDVDELEAWGDVEGGRLCLEGGIAAALGIDWSGVELCTPYKAVHSYLSLSPSQRLYCFNDKRGRTAEEVVEVLRAAALIEAAREEQDAAWATYAELVTA